MSNLSRSIGGIEDGPHIGCHLLLQALARHKRAGVVLQVAWQPFAAALLVALGAAMLAGIYPAWRLGRMEAAEALRSE